MDSFAATDAEEPNNYSHDVECVIHSGPDADYRGREICFSSNEDAVVVFDVTDKQNPRVISEVTSGGLGKSGSMPAAERRRGPKPR